MTMAEARNGADARSLRRLTAVLALYALVIQVVLGGIAALPMAATSLPFDVPCLDKAGGAEPTAPHVPAHHHPGCCTVAQPIAGLPPPLPATASIAWPLRLAVRLGWRMAVAAPVRAPPGTLASARAPPLV